MRIAKILQFILVALITIGVFASMARNSYGFTLMGTACLGLALLYITQLVGRLIADYSTLERKELVELLEMFLLAILLLSFGMRAFYIRPPYIDFIFILLCGLLMATYLIVGMELFDAAKKESLGLARNVGFFYLAILLFLLSLGTRIISPFGSVLIGVLGTMAAVLFLIPLVRQKQYDFSGKSTTLFQFTVAAKNKAGLLFLFFIFSGIYIGLSNFNVIPAIENAENPRTYIELINQAERRGEQPVNGKYKHEAYKEAMDKFTQRHVNK